MGEALAGASKAGSAGPLEPRAETAKKVMKA
jgi:hypothetical protein